MRYLYTSPECPRCKKTSTVVVDAEAVKQWEEGAMVEDAFPELDEDQHELLMTGYHPECWEKEFGDAV